MKTKIIVLEDDPHAAASIRSILVDAFPEAVIEEYHSESHFRIALQEGRIAASPPSLAVMDVILRWSSPAPETPPMPADAKLDGIDSAGIRCLRLLRQAEATRKVPVILYSILTREDLAEEWAQLPPDVHHLFKSLDRGPLVRLARKLLGDTEQRKRVFLVHGHDSEAKETVARFLEKIGYDAIILHEKAGRGRTLIQKFEDHSDVVFAVVLLTPDDVGGNKVKDLKPRARQNVIFELGFFVGRLGRDKVCALVKGGVETPSDYAGVEYVTMDNEGGWRAELATEMRAVGLDVDFNKVL